VEVFDLATAQSHYITWGRTTAEKTHPLLKKRCPLLLRIPWNVLTNSLLNIGHGADPHRKLPLATPVLLLRARFAGVALQLVYSIVGCVFVAGLFTESLPSNGSTCHNILLHKVVSYIFTRARKTY
jgi:hypothetical protein